MRINDGREFPDPAGRFSLEPSVTGDGHWSSPGRPNDVEVVRATPVMVDVMVEVGAEVEVDREMEVTMRTAGNSPSTSVELEELSWVNDGDVIWAGESVSVDVPRRVAVASLLLTLVHLLPSCVIISPADMSAREVTATDSQRGYICGSSKKCQRLNSLLQTLDDI